MWPQRRTFLIWIIASPCPIDIKQTIAKLLTEIQCWSHAATALSSFREKYENPTATETIARVNRLINEWPTSLGDDGEPMSSFETVKTTHRKLSIGLNEVRAAAEAEAK